MAISVQNVQGQTVAVLSNDFLQEGPHTFQWDTQAIAAGLYFVTVLTQKDQTIQSISKKIIVLPK